MQRQNVTHTAVSRDLLCETLQCFINSRSLLLFIWSSSSEEPVELTGESVRLQTTSFRGGADYWNVQQSKKIDFFWLAFHMSGLIGLKCFLSFLDEQCHLQFIDHPYLWHQVWCSSHLFQRPHCFLQLHTRIFHWTDATGQKSHTFDPGRKTKCGWKH